MVQEAYVCIFLRTRNTIFTCNNRQYKFTYLFAGDQFQLSCFPLVLGAVMAMIVW